MYQANQQTWRKLDRSSILCLTNRNVGRCDIDWLSKLTTDRICIYRSRRVGRKRANERETNETNLKTAMHNVLNDTDVSAIWWLWRTLNNSTKRSARRTPREGQTNAEKKRRELSGQSQVSQSEGHNDNLWASNNWQEPFARRGLTARATFLLDVLLSDWD